MCGTSGVHKVTQATRPHCALFNNLMQPIKLQAKRWSFKLVFDAVPPKIISFQYNGIGRKNGVNFVNDPRLKIGHAAHLARTVEMYSLCGGRSMAFERMNI